MSSAKTAPHRETAWLVVIGRLPRLDAAWPSTKRLWRRHDGPCPRVSATTSSAFASVTSRSASTGSCLRLREGLEAPRFPRRAPLEGGREQAAQAISMHVQIARFLEVTTLDGFDFKFQPSKGHILREAEAARHRRACERAVRALRRDDRRALAARRAARSSVGGKRRLDTVKDLDARRRRRAHRARAGRERCSEPYRCRHMGRCSRDDGVGGGGP